MNKNNDYNEKIKNILIYCWAIIMILISLFK